MPLRLSPLDPYEYAQDNTQQFHPGYATKNPDPKPDPSLVADEQPHSRRRQRRRTPKTQTKDDSIKAAPTLPYLAVVGSRPRDGSMYMQWRSRWRCISQLFAARLAFLYDAAFRPTGPQMLNVCDPDWISRLHAIHHDPQRLRHTMPWMMDLTHPRFHGPTPTHKWLRAQHRPVTPLIAHQLFADSPNDDRLLRPVSSP
ncbi:hypothetical protein CSAL01_08846 [Colletotrichum salicis]|uniref:Uncharacterized protein n=1 Tax=Colletotrichum salicis TaxID=1209931 RepID=A0A135V715_9PEZI|nr:hypothetical protein CSAL01_08846 [Colletotrichum salicis]